MNRKLIFATLAAGVIGAAGGALLWNWYAPSDDTAMADGAASDAGERDVLYWHDPMVPGPKFDKPGKSPFMDMQLVPVYADGSGAAAEGTVTVSPQVMQNLGVRTATVSRDAAARRLTAPGYVVRDDRGVAVSVDIVERDASWVRKGLAAKLTTADSPNRGWTGVVDYVSPDIDIGARSFKARIRVAQAGDALRSNALLDVTIIGPRPPRGQLMIPREALIRTGTRTAVVLALPEGRFKPVEVVPGSEVGDLLEIRQGLNEGDRVVVSGQFLIDSEANVRASFERMQAPEDAAPGPAP